MIILDMVLGYFIYFLRHLPKKGAQNYFWAIEYPVIEKNAQYDNPDH